MSLVEKVVMDDKTKKNNYNKIIANLNESFESQEQESPQDVYAEIIG